MKETLYTKFDTSISGEAVTVSTAREDFLHEKLMALCPMRVRDLRIGTHSFRLWTACDLDPLLNALAAKPPDDPDVVDERLPYWAELWPSARVLAEAVMSFPPPTREGPWLELGCGPGLPGLAARRRGVPGIWTDYMEEALWLAERNALVAGLDDIRIQKLDWRDLPSGQQAPWLLASDVAYEERNFPPLLDCFSDLLAPGGEIWFAEPGRPVARVFMEHLQAAGWRMEVLLQMDRVTVWRLRRANGGIPGSA